MYGCFNLSKELFKIILKISNSTSELSLPSNTRSFKGTYSNNLHVRYNNQNGTDQHIL